MKLPNEQTPLGIQRPRRSVPQVFQILREMIISVELKPGTVLRRAELASHFGVSQTPIRDALQKLGEEGLVDIYAQHATVVSKIDTKAALEIHFLRRALEVEVLRTLCQMPAEPSAELIRHLRANLRFQQVTLSPLDYGRLALLDKEFHQLLYEAAGVGSLWRLMQQRSGHIDRLRNLNLPKQGKARSVVSDHQAIVDALESRKVARVEEQCRKHLSGTLTFVDELKKQYPDYLI